MKWHDIPSIDRPREKLVKYGPAKLTSAELIALILGTGKHGLHVVALAEKLLKRYKATRLAATTMQELVSISGLGPTKAAALVACFELGRRFFTHKPSELMLTPAHVWNALQDIRNAKREMFIVFYLNAQSQTIEREVISMGTINTSLVHPREVFEPAIKHLASSIIVAHNHPSGNAEPSPEDMAVTKQLIAAGEILGIDVLDHIIVTHKGYVSLKQRGVWN